MYVSCSFDFSLQFNTKVEKHFSILFGGKSLGRKCKEPSTQLADLLVRQLMCFVGVQGRFYSSE